MKKWWKLLAIVLGAILSGIAYRLGGWIQTKIRDLGVPLVFLVVWCLLKGFAWHSWWVYLITYGLTFASLTTYWKPKGTPARWYHWCLHGLVIGIACLLFVWLGISWWLVVARAIVLGGLMVLVGLSTNVWVQEIGRGFFIVATIPILLI
jgi:hypothetical protein